MSSAEANWDFVKLGINGPIARVILSRPASRNALVPEMMRELISAADHLNQRQDVRVAILEGAGPSFCAGIDIAELSALGTAQTGGAHPVGFDLATLGQRMVTALRSMRPLTVAKVHGHAVGGGALLMMACDFRVIAEDAGWWLPEVDFGTPLPWGGLPQLVLEAGPMLTRELVIGCRRLTGTEVAAAGLANRAVPPSDLDRAVADLASELAAKPRAAVTVTKRHVLAVCDAMGMTSTTFADAYVQIGSLQFDDSRVAARDAQIAAGDRSTSKDDR